MADEKPVSGSVVHVELVSKDPEATKKFYHQVFGWKFENVPQTDYAMFEAPKEPHGGIRKPMENEVPGVLNYISVESVDRTLTQVTKAGGHVLMGKQEIPGWGWSAVIQAPGDVVQAIYEAGRER